MDLGQVRYLRVEQLGSLYLRQDRSDSSRERRTTQVRVLRARNNSPFNACLNKILLFLHINK